MLPSLKKSGLNPEDMNKLFSENTRTVKWGFWLILMAAFFVRTWGIHYGLPYAYHPDEPLNVNVVLSMGYRHDFNPHWFIHPALMFYFLGVLYGVYFAAGLAAGFWKNSHDFGLLILQDPSNIYLIGRIASALLSTITVAAVYEAGRKLFDNKTGLTAAVILSFLYLPVYFGHFIKTESLQTLLTLISFLFSIRIFEQGKTRDYLISGLFAGLAAAAKQPSLLVVLAGIAGHFFHQKKTRGSEWGKLLLLLTAAGAGFFAGSPFSVIKFSEMLQAYQGIKFYTVGRAGDSLQTWFHDLMTDIGPGPLLVFFLSSVYLIIKPSKKKSMAAVFPWAHFILFSLPAWKNVHWQVVTMPFFALLAADFLQETASAARRFWGWNRGLTMALLVGVMMAGPLFRCLAYDAQLNRVDTRTQAKEWIERNIPAGSKIAMERGRFMSRNAPPIRESAESIQRNYMSPQSPLLKNGYQMQGVETYYRMLIEAQEGKGDAAYDIIPLFYEPFGGRASFWQRPAIQSLEEYEAQKVEYVIISGMAEEKSSAAGSSEGMWDHFYKSLQNTNRAVLIKEFVPGNHPGPAIHIYRLKKEENT